MAAAAKVPFGSSYGVADLGLDVVAGAKPESDERRSGM
jgi:hypothetical protein